MTRSRNLSGLLTAAILLCSCAAPNSASSTVSKKIVEGSSVSPGEKNPLPGAGGFWETAAQIQPMTAFNPASFGELVKASNSIVIAKAISVGPYEGPDKMSVALTIEDAVGTQYRIRFLLPPLAVEEQGFDRLTESLPSEPALWILSNAEGNTVPGYVECAQFYHCAYIQVEGRVIPAMPDVWIPGTDRAETLEDLFKLATAIRG